LTAERTSSPAPLLPRLADPDDGPALRVGDAELTYRELAGAAAAVADAVRGRARAAVWAEPSLETCVAVVGALAAGAAVVPLNPGYGSRELEHIVADAEPQLLFVPGEVNLPPALEDVPRRAVDLAAVADAPPPETLAPDDTAFILYTSGTTGPPKGAMIPRRAISSNLDALAQVWEWTGDDRLAHALPLFHVHGLILGILGPLRRGGRAEHLGRFSAAGLAAAIERGATMVFGVPTMYNRIAEAAEDDPAVARAFGKARLLVSGSAALPSVVHRRLEALTGRSVVERYGLTETLILTAVPPGVELDPGTVGLPLPGLDLKLLDDDGAAIHESDHETIGEVVARGPSVFTGYLNLPDATAEALRDGWFHTGDLATHAAGGAIRIVGRQATDLIKSGGYKIGAGEIESALLEHPAVAEAAVAGRDDPDLGERVVAWIVRAPGATVELEEVQEHVGELLAYYKRPRQVHFVDRLPRNEMGKVLKKELVP
jgi:malonyl-CoA/methylmalonyl-CoA synthetase